MIDNTMPERLWVERISYVDEVRYDGWEESEDGDTEYIRADVAQAQLDAANARIAELEAAQVPRLVTEDMHTTPFYQRDWRGRVLAYDVINKAWYEVVWEDEISEGRSRGLSHWMPLPPPPVTDVTP